MKAFILAGGLETKISEETHLKPKPIVEIGGLLFWLLPNVDAWMGGVKFQVQHRVH